MSSRSFARPSIRRWPSGAADASVATAIRAVLGCQSVHGPGQGRRRARKERTQTGHVRQSVAGDAGDHVRQIVTTFNLWRDATKEVAERTFLTVYGSPSLQAASGIDPADSRARRARRPADRSIATTGAAHRRVQRARSVAVACVKRWCALRSMSVWRGKSADERGFEDHPGGCGWRRPTTRSSRCSQFEQLVREQFFMLLIDEEAALAAIPSLLPRRPRRDRPRWLRFRRSRPRAAISPERPRKE